MFSSLTLNLVNRFLADYFDVSGLEFGWWEGDLTITNLTVKKDLLLNNGLPFTIVVGRVEKLVVRVPWRSIYTESVAIEIRGVDLLVVGGGEGISKSGDPDTKYKLEVYKYLQQQQQNSSAESSPWQPQQQQQQNSQSEQPPSLLEVIRNNFIVEVTDLHIRYEELSGQKYSLGLVLGSLQLRTTESDYNNAKFIPSGEGRVVYKLLSLTTLSLYCNGTTILGGPRDELRRDNNKVVEELVKMRELNASPTNKLVRRKSVTSRWKFEYILTPLPHPLLVKLKLINSPESTTPPFTLPKTWITFEVQDKVLVDLASWQLINLLRFVYTIREIRVVGRFSKYRTDNLKQNNKARARWDYAGRAVLGEIEERRGPWRWGSMREYRDTMRGYEQALFSSLLPQQHNEVTKFLSRWTYELLLGGRGEGTAIKKGEGRLNLTTLLICWNYAAVKYKRWGEYQKNRAGSSPSSWLHPWGLTTAVESSPQQQQQLPSLETYLNSPMSREEKVELARLIELVPASTTANRQEYPIDYTATRVGFGVVGLEMSLSEEGGRLLKGRVEGVRVGLSSRPAAPSIRLELLIRSVEIIGDSSHGDNYLLKSDASHPIRVNYESRPISDPSSDKVELDLVNLEIYYSYALIEKLLSLVQRARRVQSSMKKTNI